MADSWRARLQRECREIHTAVRELLASARVMDDRTLRDQLEALAQKPHFAELTWLWGPAIAHRDHVLFRPFILSNFSSVTLDAKGDAVEAWTKGETAAALQKWLDAVDVADDIELTRRLYGWRLGQTPWKKQAAVWRKDLLTRFSSASSPAARFTALAKVDTGWLTLDAKTALALYAIDKAPARSFIMSHLPWFGWLGDKRRDWDALLEQSRDEDQEFHFALYRRLVEEKVWRSDLLELCQRVADPVALDAELERRHPHAPMAEAAEVFLEITRQRQRDVVPYLLRHVGSVHPRWGLARQREAKGFAELLALAYERGWLDLWAALLRTSATQDLFDGAVKRLVRSTGVPEDDIRRRLLLIAGPGREAHLPGLSLAQIKPLDEATALELYRRFPELARGPFRMHMAPGWHSAYAAVAKIAIERGDDELVDFLAARAGIQVYAWGDGRGWKETIATLTAHYEALPEPAFVARACNALSRMPAFAVWSYDRLLASNALARLLFERSNALYLSDANAIRDLLESPQIHVQALAFRILGRDDTRARAIAARNADLLQATLFRPLHRRTRLWAFKAIENATMSDDEEVACYLLARMHGALALPEKHYPTEKLVGLIAKVLHRWPALRGPAEVPHVYGETAV